MNPQAPLSVMSANLWNLNEPLVERMSRLSDLVDDVRPGVIAMQEVFPLASTPERLQLDLAGALAGYHLTYVVSHTWDAGNEGLAIATRTPPVETRSYRLPGGGPDFEPDRAVQYVRIALGNSWLGIFNTHLAYHHTSEPLRIRQAEFVGNLVGRLAAARPGDGIVVCGDLNATPDSEPVARLLATAGLANPWVDLARTKPSFASANRYNGGDPDSDSWLDYILTRNVTASELRLLDEWPDGPASDHHFVMMDVGPASS